MRIKKFRKAGQKRKYSIGRQRRTLYRPYRPPGARKRTGGYRSSSGYNRNRNFRRTAGSMRTIGAFLNNPSMEPAMKHRSLPECTKLTAGTGTQAGSGWVMLMGYPNIRQEQGWNYVGKSGSELPALKWFGVSEMFNSYNYQTCLGVKYYITITSNSLHPLQVYHGVKSLPPGETGTAAQIWDGVDPRNVAIRSKMRTFQLGPKGSLDSVKRIKRIVLTKNYLTDSPMITANRQDSAGNSAGAGEMATVWEPGWAFYVIVMSEPNMTSGSNRLDCTVNIQYRAVAYVKWTSKNNPFPNY